MSLQPVQLEVRSSSLDHDDPIHNDAKFTSLPYNTPLPSHPVVYLQHSRCPNCVWRCWQSYEQIRWKVSTYRCLLLQPCRCCCISRIQNETLFDILLKIIFIICELLFFAQQMAKETQQGSIQLSLRIISLILGRIGVFSFAIAWTLPTRNSFWFLLFGIPFERALCYHILIARCAILQIWIHFVCMLLFWWQTSQDIDATLSNLSISTNTAGLIALICVSLVFILSLNRCRRNAWELFLKTHWILFLLFFYFAAKHHYAYFWRDTYWMKVAIVCWISDVMYRAYISLLRPLVYKRRVLDLRPLAGDIVKVTVATNKEYASCGPGQYFFVCVPALTVTEWHPFSVATNRIDPNTNKETITFYIKAAGDWTRRLESLAVACHDESVRRSLRFNVKNLPIFIEGPYGQVAYPMDQYGSIVLFGGGIGITVIQNIFDHLMQYLHHNNITRMKRIHYVWVSRPLQDDTVQEFNRCHWKHVQCMKNKNDFVERFRVNQTVVITNYFFTDCTDADAIQFNRFEGVRLERPSIANIMDQAKQHDANCAVFTCGPGGLMAAIERKANQIGMHCHKEVFNF